MSGFAIFALVAGALGLGGLLQTALAWALDRRHRARTDERDDDKLDLERLRAINADALALVESLRVEHGRLERLEADIVRLNGELAAVRAELDETRAAHYDCTNRLHIAEARIAELGG